MADTEEKKAATPGQSPLDFSRRIWRPIANSRISAIHFGVTSPEEIKRTGVTEIRNKNIMQNDLPVFEGVYDPHLGTTDFKWKCVWCKNAKPDCPGHFGYMGVKYPLVVPITFVTVIHYAKIICLACGAFMLGNKRILGAKRSKLLKLYVAAARNKKKKSKELGKNIAVNMPCPSCGTPHPHITVGGMDSKKKRQYSIIINQTLYDKNGEPTTTRLYNNELRDAFNRISDETIEIVGKPLSSHPRNFITDWIAVPSNIIRPDKKVISGNRSGNDPLTVFLKNLVECNAALPDVIPDLIDLDLADKYYELGQMYFDMHLNSVDAGTIHQQQSRTANLNGVAGRIPLKGGRIRKDLMGGRSFLMARSVISGDPRLPLHVVGVPFYMARRLYKEVIVSEHNYQQCMIYFKNGINTYPGARRIIKRSTGVAHSIELLKEDVVPEIGDTLICDLTNGDKIMFGRQPSLWDLSLRCFTVQVMLIGDTIRFNPCDCVMFNADYDGDECALTASSHKSTMIEIDLYCSVLHSGTAHQDGGPIAGLFQNSLWSVAKLTSTGIQISRDRMMDMISLVPERIHLEPDKHVYTGREAISHLIPKRINMKAVPNMYNANSPIKYDPQDIAVEIKNGQLISGVLDKATVGQRKAGSLFHKITHMYGAPRTNATIFAIQQLADVFIAHYGSTIHIGDFLLSEKAQKLIDCQTENIILKSRAFHDNWRRGQIIAPIGMTPTEFHERQQIEILQLTEHKTTIAIDFDANSNNLKHANDKCGKGDSIKTEAIVSAVGQQLIRGERLTGGGWRGTVYYPCFSSDPGSYGFISSSLQRGLLPPEELAMAEDVRYGLIQIQLSTATAGHANRESGKNTEGLTINPYRQVVRQNQYIVQPLYGGQGLDQRHIISTGINHAMISDARFEAEYRATAADFGITGNAAVDQLLSAEFEQITADRREFRAYAMAVEAQYIDPRLIRGKVAVGFDIDMIVLGVMNVGGRAGGGLDPVDAIETLRLFCANLPYVFSNRFEQAKQGRIPFAHEIATTAARFVLRDRLCVKQLKKAGLTNAMLQVVLESVFIRYKQSLADAGLAVGTIAALSLHEMYTQFMLDSKHRQGTQIVDKLRGIEIIVAAKTESMKNPHMLLHVKPEFEHDHEKVMEIANKLEIVRFSQFIEDEPFIFGGEQFGAPKHRLLADQPVYIDEMKKFQGIHVPSDLTTYVILFHLNVDQMIQRYLPMDVIIHALRAFDEKVFIVHSSETVPVPSIACYVRGAALARGTHKAAIANLIWDMQNTILRGIDRITATEVVEFPLTRVAADGAMKQDNVWAIRTNGTNMRKILTIQELDIDRCQSDSIHEMADVLGIVSGYRKIITEMRVSFNGPAYAHFTIYASEMTHTGAITGITKAGANLRDNDVLPRASYVSPVPTIVEAAINGVSNKVRGASASLMLGAEIRDIGTSASKIIIDEDAVIQAQQSVEDLL